MPIKWTAPEILSGNVAELSTKCDVYVQYRFFLLPQLKRRYTRPLFFSCKLSRKFVEPLRKILYVALPSVAFPEMNAAKTKT